MSWLAWRQFRLPLVSVAGLLVVLVAVLVGAGRVDVELLYRGGQVAVYLLPAALGVFWGVPLVTRELEAGTHHLVWNQTITRRRWLAVKLAVVVGAAVVAAGVLSAVVSWWSAPLDEAAAVDPDAEFEPRLAVAIFAARGVAPVGYAVFAVLLGVAAGLLVRRTVPAMAVTLVVFAAVQLAVPLLVRPHLLPATTQSVALTAQNIDGAQSEEGPSGNVPVSLRVVRPAGSWVLTDETVDARGHVVRPLPEAVRDCLPPASGPIDLDQVHTCFAQLSGLGYHQRLVYHPGARFWPLQWLETALFLALSGLLGWLSFWTLRRHVS